MFESLRHLLPDSVAWRVIVERLLKKYLRGVATAGGDAVEFVDDVYDDLWPDTTRELAEWEKHFDLAAIGTDGERRTRLADAWADHGGQSPSYLQGALRSAGFNAYVYDWFYEDISVATDDSSFAALATTPQGFDFDAGGTELFVATASFVYRYSLAIGYDLSTVASVDSFDTGALNSVGDVVIKPGGGGFYVTDSGADIVQGYSMTGYDITTAAATTQKDVSGEESQPTGLVIKSDGTRMWVGGATNDVIAQYDLGTAWDVFTAVIDTTESVVAEDHGNSGFVIGERGQRLYMLGAVDNKVYQYALASPYDITGMAYETIALDVAATIPALTDPSGIGFGDKRKLYIMDRVDDGLYQLSRNIGTLNPNDYTNKPTRGTTQCGDDGSGINPVAECGEQPPKQKSLDSAVCNNFLANEVWYLWNDTLVDFAPPAVPDDVAYWPHFWYVGGAPFGNLLSITREDRKRFEKICLKNGPTEQWIVTMLDVGNFSEIGPYEYDDDGGTGADEDVRFNTTDLGTTTIVRVGKNDTNLVNHETLFDTIVPGNILRVALASNNAAYLECDIVEYPTIFTGWYRWRFGTATPSPAWTGFPANGTSMTVSIDPIDTSGMTLISEWKYQTAGGDPATGAFRFGATYMYIHDTDNGSTNQDAALGAIGNGDMLRFVRSAGGAFAGSWIEYDVTGESVDDDPDPWWSIKMRDDTPVAQSPGWIGWPDDQELMKIYHRESV